jgi:hypothetical protein
LTFEREHAAGHDLKAPDIRRFLSRVGAECPTHPKKCMTPEEKDFWDALVAGVPSQQTSWVLISVPLTFGPKYKDQEEEILTRSVNHEIKHAQYFLEPAYKTTVDRYWKALPPKSRKYAETALGSMTYDVTDAELIVNEFQAYLLAGRSETVLEALSDHQEIEDLTHDLEVAGTPPIMVQ